MGKVSVLDCTLRDGGYCNQWEFGLQNERLIVQNLIDAGIDLIECGVLTNQRYKDGVTKFSKPSDVKRILPSEYKSHKFVCLANYGEYDFDNLEPCDGKSIHGIRVAFHKKDMNEALAACRTVKEKGYEVYVQPMVSMIYSEEEYRELIGQVNNLHPYAFYLVDSFGMMKRKDVLHMFDVVEQRLQDDIIVGFHSHNNLQLSFSNAQALLDLSCERPFIIDTCIMGMGRGAGNLNTELFIEYLRDNGFGEYRVVPILHLIDNVINLFYQKRFWGYSLPNYLSAVHGIHPNYAGYLSEKNTLTVENMNELFHMMSEEKKYVFDKKYIERLYIEYMSRADIAEAAADKLKSPFENKRVLLIAPGLSSKVEHEKIIEFLNQENVVSISINVDYKYFNTDYWFISNIKRFETIDVPLEKNRLIVTSNIPIEEVAQKINYVDWLCDAPVIQDNAAMVALNYLIAQGAAEIYLAGLDGYGHDSIDNYAWEELQLVTGVEMLDEMNREMNKKLREFASKCKLTFLTNPRYLSL